MAKEKEEKKGEGEKAKKPAKKHLHSIHTEEAHDGSFVHHHTFKAKKEDHHTEPTRENAATSQTPEEAGQHVAEQFAQNQSQQGGEPGGDEGGEAGAEGAAPEAGAAAGGGMPGA